MTEKKQTCIDAHNEKQPNKNYFYETQNKNRQ